MPRSDSSDSDSDAHSDSSRASSSDVKSRKQRKKEKERAKAKAKAKKRKSKKVDKGSSSNGSSSKASSSKASSSKASSSTSKGSSSISTAAPAPDAASVLAFWGKAPATTTASHNAAKREALATKARGSKSSRATGVGSGSSTARAMRVYEVDSLSILPLVYTTFIGAPPPSLGMLTGLKNSRPVQWAAMRSSTQPTISFTEALTTAEFDEWVGQHLPSAQAAVSLADPRDDGDKLTQSPYVVLARKRGKFEAIEDDIPDGASLIRSCASDLQGKALGTPVKLFLALRFPVFNDDIPAGFIAHYGAGPTCPTPSSADNTSSDGSDSEDYAPPARTRKRCAAKDPGGKRPQKRIKTAQLEPTHTVQELSSDTDGVIEITDGEPDKKTPMPECSAPSGSRPVAGQARMDKKLAHEPSPVDTPPRKSIFATKMSFASPIAGGDPRYPVYEGLDWSP